MTGHMVMCTLVGSANTKKRKPYLSHHFVGKCEANKNNKECAIGATYSLRPFATLSPATLRQGLPPQTFVCQGYAPNPKNLISDKGFKILLITCSGVPRLVDTTVFKFSMVVIAVGRYDEVCENGGKRLYVFHGFYTRCVASS